MRDARKDAQCGVVSIYGAAGQSGHVRTSMFASQASRRTSRASSRLLKREATKKAVEDADFKTSMARVNSPINYLDAPEFAKYWAADAKRLAEVVKAIGKVEEQK